MKFFNSVLSPILVLNQCLMTIHLPTYTYIHNYKIIFDSVILEIPYYHIEEPDSIAPINAVKKKVKNKTNTFLFVWGTILRGAQD